MTDVNSSPPPAGWYPDPAGSDRTRWWNGFGWSDTYGETAPAAAPVGHTPPAGDLAAYGSSPSPAYAPAYGNAPAHANAPAYGAEELSAPEGTSPYTPFIWALAVLPVVGLISNIYTLVNFDQILADSLDPNAPLVAPVDIVQGAIGWVMIGLSVLLGVLDWRALKNAGVPRPFHWAWIFFSVIGVPVYMVGRSIVVRRRVGSGLAPMVVNLALIVVNFALGIVAAVVAVGAVLDSGMVP
ncbi:hypothetical protein GCM10027413_14150 [Conyzicola nivalis]|uniref:DUF2510 domain-containing protein n=1 Tax=Conyzicola nivalis TaxID=1477021 RepID=A0A916WGR0_9MICO|nr:DUF2510 domain-containing protein [Conyzicola nivalis]GGA99517.1 hypothetical protein GCM10010979_12470 [Conyzicola nivalis]